MIERVKDRVGGSMVTTHGRELACWERFRFHLHILDAWTIDTFVRMQGSLWYSMSDRRGCGVNLS